MSTLRYIDWNKLTLVVSSNIKAEEYDSEDFCRTIDINTNGTFRVAKACGRHMIKSGRGGSIIFIASMSGIIVNWPQEQCAYNASKAAVIHLSKSLAAEWAKHGVRVNSISPGYMDTALNKVPALDAQKQVWTSRTPQQRLGRVDELNNLAVFMASDASSFMTGSNVVIDVSHSHLQIPCCDVLTRLSGGLLDLLRGPYSLFVSQWSGLWLLVLVDSGRWRRTTPESEPWKRPRRSQPA